MTVTTEPKKLLKDGAVYVGDNGRLTCSSCSGHSATYSGRDLSGHPVERVTVEDVAEWPADLGVMTCECKKVALSRIAGGDGWPLVSQARRCANPTHNHDTEHYVEELDGDDGPPEGERGKCRGCGGGMHDDYRAGADGRGEYVHDDPTAVCDLIPARPGKASDCAWVGR